MICSKKELIFYIKADRMINRGAFTPSLKDRIISIVKPDYIMRYLISMRKCSYYASQKKSLKILWGVVYNELVFRKLGLKLGFSIGKNVFGYGLSIPHYGTIVIGQSNKIGNYAMIQPTSTIDNSGCNIGNNFWLIRHFE